MNSTHYRHTNGSPSVAPIPYVGIDIGGANIKLAVVHFDRDCSTGTLLQVEEIDFEFWNRRDELLDVLQEINLSLPADCSLTATMTAELADCFDSKQQGVCFIAGVVQTAFSDRKPLFYATDGNLHSADVAHASWPLIAAANWHASAWYVFKTNDALEGFFVDIGSTTTDIIPVAQGLPAVGHQSDIDRLGNGQLLYAGVGRTPIATLIDQVSFGQNLVNVAREFFATIADALLWLRLIDESPDTSNTADGQRFTSAASRRRLCRMVCADDRDLTDQQVNSIALAAVSRLQFLIVENLRRVISQFPDTAPVFFVTGRGLKLARQAIECACDDLAGPVQIETIGTDPLGQQATPAIAVAYRRRVHEQSLAGGETYV